MKQQVWIHSPTHPAVPATPEHWFLHTWLYSADINFTFSVLHWITFSSLYHGELFSHVAMSLASRKRSILLNFLSNQALLVLEQKKSLPKEAMMGKSFYSSTPEPRAAYVVTQWRQKCTHGSGRGPWQKSFHDPSCPPPLFWKGKEIRPFSLVRDIEAMMHVKYQFSRQSSAPPRWFDENIATVLQPSIISPVLFRQTIQDTIFNAHWKTASMRTKLAPIKAWRRKVILADHLRWASTYFKTMRSAQGSG